MMNRAWNKDLASLVRGFMIGVLLRRWPSK